MPETPSREQQIATLNDQFRKNFVFDLYEQLPLYQGDIRQRLQQILTQEGGFVRPTEAVQHLHEQKRQELYELIRSFDTFTPDNDPWEEHDFGSIELDGKQYFFKIEYARKDNIDYGSEAPEDPNITARIMTIMEDSEY